MTTPILSDVDLHILSLLSGCRCQRKLLFPSYGADYRLRHDQGDLDHQMYYDMTNDNGAQRNSDRHVTHRHQVKNPASRRAQR